jgi:hypothetical protein
MDPFPVLRIKAKGGIDQQNKPSLAAEDIFILDLHVDTQRVVPGGPKVLKPTALLRNAPTTWMTRRTM